MDTHKKWVASIRFRVKRKSFMHFAWVIGICVYKALSHRQYQIELIGTNRKVHIVWEHCGTRWITNHVFLPPVQHCPQSFHFLAYSVCCPFAPVAPLHTAIDWKLSQKFVGGSTIIIYMWFWFLIVYVLCVCCMWLRLFCELIVIGIGLEFMCCNTQWQFIPVISHYRFSLL